MKDVARPLLPLNVVGLSALGLTVAILALLLLLGGRASAETTDRGIPSFDSLRAFGELNVGVVGVAAFNLDSALEPMDEIVVASSDGSVKINAGLQQSEFSSGENMITSVAAGRVAVPSGGVNPVPAIIVGGEDGRARFYIPARTAADQPFTANEASNIDISTSSTAPIEGIMVAALDDSTPDDLIFVARDEASQNATIVASVDGALSVPLSIENVSSVALGDIDTDLQQEILVGTNGGVIIYDASTENIGTKATITTDGVKSATALATAPIGVRGATALIAAVNGTVRIYASNDVATTPEFEFCSNSSNELTFEDDQIISRILVTDLNGDQRADLVLGNDQSRSAVAYLKHPLAAICSGEADAQELYGRATLVDEQYDRALPGRYILAANLNGDGQADLVLANENAARVTRLDSYVSGQTYSFAETMLLEENVAFAIAALGEVPQHIIYDKARADGNQVLGTTQLLSTTPLLPALQSNNSALRKIYPLKGSIAGGKAIAAVRDGQGAALYSVDPSSAGESYSLVAGPFGPGSVNALAAASLDSADNDSIDVIALGSGSGVSFFHSNLESTIEVPRDQTNSENPKPVGALAFGQLFEPAGVSGIDLVVGRADGSTDGSVVAYLGNGSTLISTTFLLGTDAARAITLTTAITPVTSILVADLIPDGHPEVYVARSSGNVEAYAPRQNGTLGFERLSIPQLGAQQLTAADVDDDGRDDIVARAGDGTIIVLYNRLEGFISFIVSDTLPFDNDTNPDNGPPNRLAAGDLTGDGRAEIMVNVADADDRDGNQPGLLVFTPVPSPAFTPSELTFGKTIENLSAVGDMDGDGSLDLVAVGGNAGSIYTNPNANGVLSRTLEFSLMGYASSLALADIDGNGELDIIAGTSNGVEVQLKQDNGTFASSFTLGEPGQISELAIGDLDGDDDPDLVAGAWEQPTKIITLSPPTATAPITWVTSILTDTRLTRITVADLDGATDHQYDLDIIGVRGDNSLVVYRAIGFGAHFPLVRDLPRAADLSDLALGDVNGDSLLDVVTTYGSGPSEVRLYSDTLAIRFPIPPPVFTSFGLIAGYEAGVALGDMNGDNSLDVVSQGWSSNGTIFFRRGEGYRPDPLPGGRCTEAPRAQVACFGRRTIGVTDLHLADFNGDGALDIVTTRSQSDEFNHAIYFNDGSGVTAAAQPLFEADDFVTTLQAGDLDRDGKPDLVAGSSLFLEKTNIQVRLSTAPAASYSYQIPIAYGGAPTMAVADFTGDGRDDVAVGMQWPSSYQNLLTINDAGKLTAVLSRTFGLEGGFVQALTAGDYNGDGLADLAVAYEDGASLVLLNLGSEQGYFALLGANETPVPEHGSIGFGNSLGRILSLLAVDIDSDGDPDLVTGAEDQPSAVYLNDGSGNFAASADCNGNPGVRCFGTLTTITSLTVADINRDGRLDIITAERRRPQTVYFQQADGTFFNNNNLDCFAPDLAKVRCFGDEAGFEPSLIAADFNGDGHPDVAVRSDSRYGAIYFNDGAGGLRSRREINTEGSIDALTAMDLGPEGGDGRPDLVIADGAQVLLMAPLDPLVGALPNNPPRATLTSPCPLHPSGSDCRFGGAVVTSTLTLADPEEDPVRAISVTFSINGGATWRPATGKLLSADGKAFTQNNPPTDRLFAGPFLTNCAKGCAYHFEWEPRKDGVFGRSDAVFLRVVAYPGDKNTVPGDGVLRPYVAAQSPAFTVINEPIRVVIPFAVNPGSYCKSAGRCVQYLPLTGEEVSGGSSFATVGLTPALEPEEPRSRVYVVPPSGGQARVLTDSAGLVLLTDRDGILRGRTNIAPGSQLLALMPYRTAKNEKFRVFLTNGVIEEGRYTGLPVYSGDQATVELEINKSTSLTLLDLSVSLEWELAADDPYWDTVKRDLERTSELLYNWTLGQVALGDVHVYDKKREWDSADIRIYASNAIRPNATIGGIGITRPDERSEILPGQVRMGATWNRYGERNGTFGEDWPRALAHELGHYVFSLQDNYLGFDDDGQLAILEKEDGSDTCPGVMTNPYIEDGRGTGVEFRSQPDWLLDCANTLLHRTYLASDWTVMDKVFPWLTPPNTLYREGAIGPSALLIDVTEVKLERDSAGDAALLDPPIIYLNTSVSESARAVILPADSNRAMVDLGRPFGRELVVRGARMNDQICVFDLFPREPQREPLRGCTKPAESRRIALVPPPRGWQPELIVTPVNSKTVQLQLTITSTGELGQLTARLFTDLGEQVGPTALEPSQQGRAFTAILTTTHGALGGSLYIQGPDPGYAFVADYGLGGSPARSLASGGVESDAPVLSPDGQVVIYGPDLSFAEGQFYTLQSAVATPPIPAGRTLVGQTYRLSASSEAPSLENAFISFSYLEREVPPNEERWLHIYYFDEQQPALGWQKLETSLVDGVNAASAVMDGPGVYALMSSIEIQLAAPYTLFAYPVPNQLPVATALASIDGLYTAVLEFDPFVPLDQWKIYEPGPAGRKTLTELRFGYGYWIVMEQNATLYLKGVGADGEGEDLNAVPLALSGRVVPENGVRLAQDAAVKATIGGEVCGEGRIFEQGGQLFYAVLVAPRSAERPACGGPGREIHVSIKGQQSVAVPWTAEPQPLSMPMQYIRGR